ncbi:B9 domain-containing protein [Cardiosporidium cionae]|uniref:B9 domain-containing protein 2 n=1 Tax=Cardiosporidium cionae TaxID=476202 RepID=A0ABQ7JBJ0_9APIC|nr:B9 domain-containing protein [Cardiosporidium cionae]|eukprot:KAF8821362.1 B9 domain-containing protein [Cardiosporidium cionae]
MRSCLSKNEFPRNDQIHELRSINSVHSTFFSRSPQNCLETEISVSPYFGKGMQQNDSLGKYAFHTRSAPIFQNNRKDFGNSYNQSNSPSSLLHFTSPSTISCFSETYNAKGRDDLRLTGDTSVTVQDDKFVDSTIELLRSISSPSSDYPLHQLPVDSRVTETASGDSHNRNSNAYIANFSSVTNFPQPIEREIETLSRGDLESKEGLQCAIGNLANNFPVNITEIAPAQVDTNSAPLASRGQNDYLMQKYHHSPRESNHRIPTASQKAKESQKPPYSPKISKTVPSTRIEDISRTAKFEIHFIGEIIGGQGFSTDDGLFCVFEIAVTDCWKPLSGTLLNRQQTQTSYADEAGIFVWNHPINLHLETYHFTHAPRCKFSVWKLDKFETISSVSYGAMYLPCVAGIHSLNCRTWTQSGDFHTTLAEIFLNRKAVVNEHTLAKSAQDEFQILRTESSGSITLNIDVILFSSME